MTEKVWDELTDSEKIAELRNDVVRLFTALREMASEQDRLRSEVSEAIKRLDSTQAKTGRE
jgi:hypothetical protein